MIQKGQLQCSIEIKESYINDMYENAQTQFNYCNWHTDSKAVSSHHLSSYILIFHFYYYYL